MSDVERIKALERFLTQSVETLEWILGTYAGDEISPDIQDEIKVFCRDAWKALRNSN